MAQRNILALRKCILLLCFLYSFSHNLDKSKPGEFSFRNLKKKTWQNRGNNLAWKELTREKHPKND